MRSSRISIQSILVGVDWFDPCQVAIDRACRLSLPAGAKLTLLHVVHRDLGLSPFLKAFAEEDAPVLLEKAAQRARQVATAAGSSLQIETLFRSGLPFMEIVREVRARAIDLVIVGRHAKRSFSEALIGTTAERVVRKARTAVLVTTTSNPYCRPLFAVDMSDTCGRAVQLGLQILDSSVATADVIHAVDTPEQADAAKAEVTAFLEGLGLSGPAWNVLIRVGDSRQMILAEASQRTCDLIVVGTHGRAAIAQLLVGSVAEAVLRNARCDVLLARPAEHSFELP